MAECQSRQLAEVIATLDGAYLTEPVEPCHEPGEDEVYIDHVIGLRVRLCWIHERVAVLIRCYRRSVRIRST